MPNQRVIEYGPVLELPERSYELLVMLTISGEPGRKSNQRRIVTNTVTGKPMLIKSEKALDYVENSLAQVPASCKRQLGGPHEPLALWARIYYRSNRPDLSTELLQDVLQQAGIITNDRWIKQVFAFGAVDRENPRSEVKIFRICNVPDNERGTIKSY